MKQKLQLQYCDINETKNKETFFVKKVTLDFVHQELIGWLCVCVCVRESEREREREREREDLARKYTSLFLTFGSLFSDLFPMRNKSFSKLS